MRSLALAILCLLASAGIAQDQSAPQDQGKLYLTVFTHSNWKNYPSETRVLEELQKEPLLGFAKDCHFNHYTEKSPFYLKRFAEHFSTDSFPVLILQKADGTYWYKASGDNIGATSEEILEDIVYYGQLALELESEQHLIEREPILPWRAAQEEPDSLEIFGAKTPVRDSLASGAIIMMALVAFACLMGIMIVGIIVLKIIS